MSPYGYKTDPMDATNVDGAKRNAANASDDFAVDEDMIEDDDEEVDAEEIIVQVRAIGRSMVPGSMLRFTWYDCSGGQSC